MKILHVTHGFLPVGGLETFLPILINGMPEDEHTITVWKNRKGNLKFNSLVEIINLESLYELENIVRELKPDLIHIHYTGPESLNDSAFVIDDKYRTILYKDNSKQTHDDHPFGYLYIHDLLFEAGIPKPKIIITCHSAFRMPLTVMKPHIDAIVSVSHKAQEEQAGIGANHHVIYNGLDTDKFKPSEVKRKTNEKIIVLWSGNLIKYDLVVYNLLKSNEFINSKCEFIFLGEGSIDKDPLPNYKFIGHGSLNDVADFMKDCDIFLYPSTVDSFSYAVAEAMASGMCVLGSEVVSEVIGDSGLVYKSPEQAIETLKWFIKRINIEVEGFGILARDRAVQYFSSDKMIESYKKLYQEVTKENYSNNDFTFIAPLDFSRIKNI